MTKVKKFGTFGGVFTPSILTILGVIMYLRLPMILGEAGLYSALFIILIAHVISITTGLSVSSIATDKKVEAGGTYFMISRSMGLPIGGTLGLALFVGLSFSVSLYLIGFAESFLSYWGYEVSINTIRLTGTLVLIAVTTITFISTSLAIKTQYFIMAAIFLSLVSIFFGRHEFGTHTVIDGYNAPAGTIPFMVLFGIFFPAVTGFEAGVSMSGDLQNPKRSIPKGSILAIGVGLLVYIGLTFFLSSTVNANMLANDPQVLLKISWIPELVIAGIWGATLSSALGSILGAPRILQATAVDQITPRLFAHGVGATNEPKNALLLTFLIAEAGILIGELDVIARIVSIFFITTYGFLNLSCAFESWTSADFRPSFKSPAWVSFLGAAACFMVMIQLDFVATLGALFILGGLFVFLKRKELSLETGDAWSGVWTSITKTSLQRLASRRGHSRNWRPNILMFSGPGHQRPYLVKTGKALAGKLGMLTAFELEVEKDAHLKPQLKQEATDEQDGFWYTYRCDNIYKGIDELARLHGFPGIEPNTVLMGWSQKPENREQFLSLMANIQRYNLNALFWQQRSTELNKGMPVIDIWWSGWGNNLALALNILRHLTSSDPWVKATVRLGIILQTQEDADRVYNFIKRVLDEYRVSASIRVIDNHVTQLERHEIIGKESGDADLVIIGIPDSSYDNLETTYHYVNRVSERLKRTLFINAANSFEEHMIIDRERTKTKEDQAEWELPVLETSRFDVIREDIQKIDAHGQQMMRLLHQKVFERLFAADKQLYSKLEQLVSGIDAALEKALQMERPQQRKSPISRAKRFFLSQMTETVMTLQKRDVAELKETVQQGLSWYIQQLEKDANLFPKQKKVVHDKKEFQFQPTDSPGLRWFKIRKRLRYLFTPDKISIRLNYREGASYFLRDSRFHFLLVLLKDASQNLTASHDKLGRYLGVIDDSLKAILHAQEAEQQNQLIRDFKNELKVQLHSFLLLHKNLVELYDGRLQVEYRKNLIFFMHQSERIDFNRIVRQAPRSEGFYRKKKELILGYSQEFSKQLSLDLGTLKASIVLYNHVDLVEEQITHYTHKLNQHFEKESSPASKLAETLEGYANARSRPADAAIPELDFDQTYPFEMFEDVSGYLRGQLAQIPETIALADPTSEEKEELTLPLRAMVAHLMETKVTGPINDLLIQSLERIQKSNLIIKDQTSLAMFNIFNMDDGAQDPLYQKEVERDVKAIRHEIKKLVAEQQAATQAILVQTSELKQSLRIQKLAALVDNFSSLVRVHRQKSLRNKVVATWSNLQSRIQSVFVSVLYSQTKGILLARKFTTSRVLSSNERIMQAVTQATPNHAALHQLPHFYISLFSGRSSIGDNFWVARPVEERQLDEAYQQFLRGKEGMILMLGERNSGKTALARRFANSHSKNVIQVFPGESGSVNWDDFESALRKAARLEGSAHQVLSLLPHQSMVVIQDLELWWERSGPAGLVVIQKIKELIEAFSGRILFVVNMNPFAFEVINQAEPLDTHCARVVRCQPFNSLDLKRLIMTRHQSSGLTVVFGKSILNRFWEVRMARIFNRLFSYSGGNPGVAMIAWLNGIHKFANNEIHWIQPQPAEQEIFDQMPEMWSHVMLQLLMHKRMSLEKMYRCIQADRGQILNAVNSLRRLDLVSLRGPTTYYLNPDIEFLLISYFRKKGWI
ncbi:MAG: hypothetical protein AB7K37_09710 [Cyclobacteriaceae bacterium]